MSGKSDSHKERKTLQMPPNYVGAAVVAALLILVIGHALKFV